MGALLVALAPLAPLVRAQTVVATVPVGSLPYGVAYDSGKGEVFVTNWSGGTVSVISDATNTVVANVSVGVNPSGVAYDSAKGEVFVDDADDSTVSVISDATNEVVATVSLGLVWYTAHSPDGAAYDSGKGEIFVANSNSEVFGGTVSVISDTNNTVVATVSAEAYDPSGVAYDSAKGEVFVTDYLSDTISIISDTTNTVVAVVNVGLGPSGIAYDSGKGEVFVANAGGGFGNTVSVISDATNTVVANVNVGHDPQGIAYDSGKGEVFVATGGAVSVISDATNIVVANVSVGAALSGVAYDSARGEVFVANSIALTLLGESQSISVISDATIAASFDFNLTTTGNLFAVNPGGTTQVPVQVGLVSGTPSLVSVTVAWIPTGSNQWFTTQFSTPSGDPPFTSTLTIQASNSVPQGTYQAQILASGGGHVKSAMVDVAVGVAPAIFGISNTVTISDVDVTAMIPSSSSCTFGPTTLTQCFSVQQNFFVAAPEGSAPPNWSMGHVPGMASIWVQNLIDVGYESGSLKASAAFQVWSQPGGTMLLCNGKVNLENQCYDEQVNFIDLTSPFELNSTISGTELSLTNSYWTSSSQPFTYPVPNGAIVYDSQGDPTQATAPEIVIVGAQNGAVVSFGPSTSGIVTSRAELEDSLWTSSVVQSVLFTLHKSTLETSQNLLWSLSGSSASFEYSSVTCDDWGQGVGFVLAVYSTTIGTTTSSCSTTSSAATSSTTMSTSSGLTSQTPSLGPIPEFPAQLGLALLVMGAIVTSYVVTRRIGPSRKGSKDANCGAVTKAVYSASIWGTNFDCLSDGIRVRELI